MENGTNITPGIGHNNPPMIFSITDLRVRREALAERSLSLRAAGERALEHALDYTDEVHAKMVNFVRQITAHLNACEAARKADKAPYIEAGKAVDAYYRELTGEVDEFKRRCGSLISDHIAAKEAAERVAREEAAAAERAEAERIKAETEAKEAAAREAGDAAAEVEARAEAVQAEARAEAAERIVDAPSDAAVTRTAAGTSARLQSSWVVTSVDRATLDLETLRPYIAVADLERAVKAYIRSGGRELAGAEIVERKRAVVR